MMQIIETTTKVRNAECFVVDYDRLLPNGWPLMAPIDTYEPLHRGGHHGRVIDRAEVLDLLLAGWRHQSIADHLGCSVSSVAGIRAEAAEARKAAWNGLEGTS